MPRSLYYVLLLIFALNTPVFADGNSDAQKLKDEALDILKANATKQASAAQYALCIFKLEQAQSILDKSGDHDSNLAQEINTSLFWARKFSNTQVISELEKLRGGSPEPQPVKKIEPPKPPPPTGVVDKDHPPESSPAIAEAKKAFEAAEKFAQAHANDDYAVALSWFKMASEHSGTDYALKAMSLARAAQERFAAGSGPQTLTKELSPDSPEMKLLAHGESLAKANKFEEAIADFRASLEKKETMIAHSKLGHACFDRGQQMKDDLLPKIEKADKDYREAWKNAQVVRRSGMFSERILDVNNPAYVAAKNKCDDLARQSYKAIEFYDKAEAEFKSVLRLAPDNKELDAAGHIGLCLAVHGDLNFRLRAVSVLTKFVADYAPTNDIERSVYEFCKTELARLKKL
jgi:tetratricopeptide (TPR) repeat protein